MPLRLKAIGSAVARLARKATSAVLTVSNTTQGILVAAELKRAYLIALGAAGVAGGLGEALSYLATDGPFLNAIAPTLQGLLARAGLIAVPLPLVVSALTFVLAHGAALLKLRNGGRAATALVAGDRPGQFLPLDALGALASTWQAAVDRYDDAKARQVATRFAPMLEAFGADRAASAFVNMGWAYWVETISGHPVINSVDILNRAK